VTDVAASSQFYREVMGFTSWFSYGEAACGVMFGEGRVLLHKGEPGPGVKSTGLYIVVDSGIDEVYAKLKDRVTILTEIGDRHWGDRTFELADPDGYRIEFAQERKS
jgi:catechol 2,3-dioxygenase-like lactoylglutathione lyase family enzyme